MSRFDKREAAVRRAMDLLREGFSVEPKGWAVDSLLRLYMESSRPPIRPYHVEEATIDVYYYMAKNRLEVFAERKYDGTHMQISGEGIFKHGGGVASSDQLAYLMLYCIENEEAFKRVYGAIREGYTLEFELFGRAYTPMGFHRSHPKLVDVRVFEIGYEGKWIPPPEKYEVLKGLPHPEYYKVEYEGLDDLIERLNELALAPETFEGIVAKSRFVQDPELPKEYAETSTLVLFKVKKETIREREKIIGGGAASREEAGIDVETLATLRSEIRNEIGKLKTELGEDYLKDRRSYPEIISRIEGYLRNEHPQTYRRVVSSTSIRDLRKIIANLLTQQTLEAKP